MDMTPVQIKGRGAVQIRALLAKAEEKGLDHRVVRTTSDGVQVPACLIAEPEPEPEEVTEPERQADATEPQKTEKPGFDPGDTDILGVKNYLESAGAEERERVFAAEREGKARKGVMEIEEEST